MTDTRLWPHWNKKPYHGGASADDRRAEDLADRRRGPWRKLDLIHGNRTFLRRTGIDTKLFGIFIHHIDGEDPGQDLHDHPWPFVSCVLRGGYSELACETRKAHLGQYKKRTWKRWSWHKLSLTEAHRIIGAEPGTLTILFRGRKRPEWGFYLPTGYVSQFEYDYQTRRPVEES